MKSAWALIVLLVACGGPTKPVRDLVNAVEELHREVVEGLPAWEARRKTAIPSEIDAQMPPEAYRAVDRYEAREKALVDHAMRVAALERALEEVPPSLDVVRRECDAADVSKRGVDVQRLSKRVTDVWVIVEIRGREAGVIVPSLDRVR